MKKVGNAFGIILICFLVLLMLFSDLITANWNTVGAVVDGFSYSVEEIDNIRVENQKEVDEELAKYPDLHFRNLTEEEIKALSNGQISQDDVPYLVTGRKVFANGVVMTVEEYEKSIEKDKDEDDKKNNIQEQNDNNTGEKTQPVQTQVKNEQSPEMEPEPPKTNPELEAVLEKFFVLKANLLADIERRIDIMIDEYETIPKKERTKAVKSEYANKALSLMADMEPQYDAQFEAVVAELEAVIEKIDGDESLVTTVRDAYKKEKATLKAKYVSKARKHL